MVKEIYEEIDKMCAEVLREVEKRSDNLYTPGFAHHTLYNDGAQVALRLIQYKMKSETFIRQIFKVIVNK